MKKLEKLHIKDLQELSKEEMKALIGGKIIYYCMRKKFDPYTGASIFYTFETSSADLAYSWCGFWDSAGWDTAMFAKDDGTGTSPYYYV